MTQPSPDPGTVAADAVNAAAVNNTAGTATDSMLPNDAQIAQHTLKIDPTSPPPMQTLVYSPEVRIVIAHGTKQYDVSNDVVAFSIKRIENGVSSAAFRLSNKANPTDPKKLRYNLLFERMDRVIIYLKRSEWYMAFSGYLDRVPFVQLYPGTVDFRASCTLKRLQHTWWDPGLPTSMEIFDQPARQREEEANGERSVDKGLGSLLRRLLVKVGGWNPEHVHIQRFPAGFFAFMEQQLRRLSPGAESAVQDFKELLLGEGDTSLGPGRSASRQQGVTMGGYVVGKEERMLEVVRAVDEMGMGVDVTNLAVAQGIATAGTGGQDQKDRPGWQAFQELGKNYQDAALKSDAAVHCFMTIMTESSFRMLANLAVPESLGYPNDGVGPDGTSVGLYQQQNFGEWGSLAQRMNVKASTQMFLQHLQRLDWRNMDRAAACQAVQRSSFSDGRNYKAWEDWAVEQVRAIRSGTGTSQGAGGQNNTGTLSSTGTVTLPGPTSASLPGVSGTAVPGVPTVNGTAGATAVAGQAGQPLYNTAGALSCAMSRIGAPYVSGAKGPDKFDCSGLTQFSYRSIGIDIGPNTSAQKANGQKIPFSNLVPGDLIFPAEYDHVVMYVGGNQMIDCPDVGQTVQVRTINFDINAAECRHIAGTEYGGSPVAPFDIARAMSGNNAAAGTVTTGLNGSTGTGQTEPIARNLFTYQFFAGQFTSAISTSFGGQPGSEEKAFINDEPLIQTVISFAKAGLRNFQSAPNGDFIAYYPDYFGLDGTEAVWNLEDIEMKNVQIDWNDDALATHVYVSGSPLINGSGGGGVPGWLGSKGVATVENEWLFRRMTFAAPHLPGEFLKSGVEIMRKFGARPLVQSMSSVYQGPMEFLCAVQLFMTKWAEQYSTQIETTFMPGIFPGMRLNLVGHNLQVYVTEVTHSGDYESGFTTSMTIMAPSNPEVLKLRTSVFNANSAELALRQDLVNNETEVVGG